MTRAEQYMKLYQRFLWIRRRTNEKTTGAEIIESNPNRVRSCLIVHKIAIHSIISAFRHSPNLVIEISNQITAFHNVTNKHVTFSFASQINFLVADRQNNCVSNQTRKFIWLKISEMQTIPKITKVLDYSLLSTYNFSQNRVLWW